MVCADGHGQERLASAGNHPSCREHIQMRTVMSCLNLLHLPRWVGQHIGLWWVLSAALMGLPHAWADRSYFPLPIFTTDPNERQTYGALLAVIDEREGAFHS